MRGVIGADGIFGFQIVVDLGNAGAEAVGDERVRAGGRVVGGFREGVVAFKADVVTGAFLEADLERVVPSAGAETGESAESAVKLRIRVQEVDQWNLIIVIDGFRFVENSVGTREERLEGIGHGVLQAVGGSEGCVAANVAWITWICREASIIGNYIGVIVRNNLVSQR